MPVCNLEVSNGEKLSVLKCCSELWFSDSGSAPVLLLLRELLLHLLEVLSSYFIIMKALPLNKFLGDGLVSQLLTPVLQDLIGLGDKLNFLNKSR